MLDLRREGVDADVEVLEDLLLLLSLLLSLICFEGEAWTTDDAWRAE